MVAVVPLAIHDRAIPVSDATAQLLLSTGFIAAIAIGSVAVIGVMIWAAIARRPAPLGGVILTAGMVFVIGLFGELPIGLVVGLCLILVAGVVPVRSPIVTMATLAPGAVAISMTLPSDTRTVAMWLVVVAIIPFAPLVASFDRRNATSTVATPLVAISFVTVFLTVPDTEIVVLAAGFALPWLVAGPPARLARLGRAGAFTVVGMLVWLVASGGYGRTGSMIAGVATLGVLVIEPVAIAIGEARQATPDADESRGLWGTASLIAGQIAIAASISIAIRL